MDYDLQPAESKSDTYNDWAETAGYFAHNLLEFSTSSAVIGNFTVTYDQEGNLVKYKNNLDTEF